jgi:hypothetical protein
LTKEKEQTQTKTPLSQSAVEGIVINAFRELRLAWFNAHLRRNPHEREWENEEAEKQREEDNAELKEKFDAQTEAIILGEKFKRNPRCYNDLA